MELPERLVPAALFATCFGLLAPGALRATVFDVTSYGDQHDANPGNGVCATPGPFSACTLRAAVEEANALAGFDQIVLPAGNYAVGFPELALLDDVRIQGGGSFSTVLTWAGGSSGRFFQIDAAVVFLRDLRIRGAGGPAIPQGGAIAAHLGSLNVQRVWFEGNSAQYGGALYTTGDLLIRDSTFSANSATDAFGAGGALYVGTDGNQPEATIVNTTFVDNSAYRGGAIVVDAFGWLELYSVTFAENVSTALPPIAPSSAIWTIGNHLYFEKTLFAGTCDLADSDFVGSAGGNVESPDHTCLSGFSGDQPNVPGSLLRLSGMGLWGGTTPTLVPGIGSVAVDPPLPTDAGCPGTDQRGFARDVPCDVGAVERTAGDLPQPILSDTFDLGSFALWSGVHP